MRISAIVWGDSVSPMDTCSSAGSDFLQTTCLVKDLASPKKLKGKGGGGFSLCPRQPRAGSVPQTWPGAAHAPAPFPGASKGRLGASPTPLATAPTRPSSFLGGPGQDRDPGVGGLRISGLAHPPFTRLLPPLTGAQHTPQETWQPPPGLYPRELVPLDGAWPRCQVRLVGQPPLEKAGKPSQACSGPGVTPATSGRGPHAYPPWRLFSPEPRPGH